MMNNALGINIDPALAGAFLTVNTLWLIVLAGHISRYFFNRNAK